MKIPLARRLPQSEGMYYYYDHSGWSLTSVYFYNGFFMFYDNASGERAKVKDTKVERWSVQIKPPTKVMDRYLSDSIA